MNSKDIEEMIKSPVILSEAISVNESSLSDALDYVGDEIEYMIRLLNNCRGEERSDRSRNIAILITELQKVYAWYKTYLAE